jgi:hypothetical protein
MQRLEISGAVRPIQVSLDVKGLLKHNLLLVSAGFKVLITRFVAVFIYDIMVIHGTINGVDKDGRRHGMGMDVEEIM